MHHLGGVFTSFLVIAKVNEAFQCPAIGGSRLKKTMVIFTA